MSSKPLKLDGMSITLEVAERTLAGESFPVRLTRAAERAVRRSRQLVQQKVRSDEALYGINTGFGRLSGVRIDDTDLASLQVNLLLSHACGVGPPLAPGVARLALLLRANSLARGHSGVRPELIALLLHLFEAGVAPLIPSQGSVGASGDLAPLAHLALLLIGQGEGLLDGRRMTAARMLGKLGLEPLTLCPKEGLALINGTQISTALAVEGLVSGKRLLRVADVALTMTLEALRGSVRAFDPRIHTLRPHPGQQTVSSNVRRLLKGSKVLKSHRNCGKVQDPYSLRCAPQVHGAARDTAAHVEEVLVREMNSVTDNPLLFPDDEEILNGGNFHAEPIAMVADFLAIALAELASISERRTENLVNPDLSGLPAFLSPTPGLHSGFMVMQVTAAALVSENKTLCHPASIDSIPTSAGKEDHVSMATWAARKLGMVAENTRLVLAIELLAAAQGLDLHEPWIEPGRGVVAAYRTIRSKVRKLTRDRVLAPDIARLRQMIEDGSLLAAVEQVASKIA